MRLFPELEYAITPRYLTAPSKRRAGLLLRQKVRFLVVHDTGNSGSTAAANVSYYQSSRNTLSASAHLFVDDRQILECVPALTGPPEKAWHVRYSTTEDKRRYGCKANDAAIGVEYCFGPHINADEAYRRFVWLLAYACWKFGLDPARDIVGHHLLDPGRKTDPQTGLARSYRSYRQLLLDVPAAYDYYTGKAAAPPAAGIEVQGVVVVRAPLNIRKGEPFRRAPARLVPAGTRLPIVGKVTGERVRGNSRWYALPNNEFCWSGAVVPA